MGIKDWLEKERSIVNDNKDISKEETFFWVSFIIFGVITLGVILYYQYFL